MIAVIDYQAGNIGSVANALKKLGVEYTVTGDPLVIKRADGIIFPGQGRAGPAMDSLHASGISDVLLSLSQPFLGICLGMQLMVEKLDEDNRSGLGIIPGECRKLENVSPIPHMGWNSLHVAKKSQLLNNVASGEYVYFAHSYAVKTDEDFVAATTDYGGRFAAVVTKDNFFGLQFHPEKSAAVGEQILKNFMDICKENK